MEQRIIKTFEDLMRGHSSATISCLHTKKVVRHLERIGGVVWINPNSDTFYNEFPIIHVHLMTEIHYEPWEMDRGSLLFEHVDFKPFAKICGEGDLIQFEDGTIESIIPDPSCQKVPHKVVLNTHF